MRKPKILILMPWGFNIESTFGNRLRFLSNYYQGKMFLYSTRSIEETYGNFVAKTIIGKKNILTMLAAVSAELKSAQLAADPYDLIVSYDPLKMGIIAAIAAKKYKIKLVTEINGVFTSKYNFSDMPNKLVAKFKEKAFPFVEKHVIKASDGIKLLYPSQIDYFKPLINLDKKVVHAFSNHIDVTRFKNLGEKTEILFVGFPFYRKGVDVLIDAFKEVSSDFPDWTLKIIGWFSYKDLVEQYIGGHPKIELHPPVDNSEMPLYLGSTGIFVLPSRSEGMGRVLLEAMACEKPRIGSNIEGIPSVIDHGTDGLLVEPGSKESLAAALRTLMNDSALREKLGKAAKQRLDKELTEEAYFRKLNNFYETVLKQKK